MSEDERAKLAVWDYPVSDKYTKIWAQIQEATLPTSFADGLSRVKLSGAEKESSSGSSNKHEEFAFVAEATMVSFMWWLETVKVSLLTRLTID